MIQAGFQQAVIAFLENEPYCPRPKPDNKYADYLWKLFSKRYLWTSDRFIKEEFGSLPRMFLQGVETIVSQRHQEPENQGGNVGRGGYGSTGGGRGCGDYVGRRGSSQGRGGGGI